MSFKYIAIAATALTMVAGAASAQVRVPTDNGVGLFDAGGLYGPAVNNGSNGFPGGTAAEIDTMSTASTGERVVAPTNAPDTVYSQRELRNDMFDEYGNIPRK